MTARPPANKPENALRDLAARLRDEDTVISEHVREPAEQPVLGILAAAGPRAAGAPAEYAFVIEAIREGYLMHYGEPRVLAGTDDDLGLLAGDYLYALGLERLAALADMEAVRELSDLISLQAQLHAGTDSDAAAEALWLASTIAVAAGSGESHVGGKAMLREGGADAADRLRQAAFETAAKEGLEGPVRRCAEALTRQ